MPDSSANLTPKTAFGKTISLGEQNYTFVAHKTALPMAYAQIGGKGTVYQLRGGDGQLWALKVFHPQFRHPRITSINGALKENYEYISSVTIWKRLTIRRPKHNVLLEAYPDLEYAVLMPWVEGDNWENFWGDDELVQRPDATNSLRLAVELGKTLSQMEQAAIAHCDLAGSNIMVDPARLRVELIDIEDSFIHGIEPPAKGNIPLGTSGYQHAASRKLNLGVWCVEGDRFAGGVLLAELLTWHVPEIRAAADGAKHYFQDADLEKPSLANDRFKLMIDVLKTSSTEIADLFTRTWAASRLENCPKLVDWQMALAKAHPADASVFKMLETPAMNIVEYPSEDESDGPLFSWGPVKGAEDYVLEIGRYAETCPKLIVCSDNRYASKGNAEGKFQARVKAHSGRRESAWSEYVVFGRLPASTLNKGLPPNEVRLSWTPVADASYYVLSIVGNTIPPEERNYETTECIFDFAAYAPGVYALFVRAFGIVGGFRGKLVGYASNSTTISVPARKLEGLTVRKAGFTVDVTWQHVEYAASYRVSCLPLGRSGFDAHTQEVQSAHADFRLPPGAYEFQVIALTEDGIPSVPAVRRETIGGLKTPLVTLTDERNNPLIQWDSIDYAEKYRLVFERTGKPLRSIEILRNNYMIGTDWEPGTYQLKVQALAVIDGLPEVVSSEPSPPVVVSIRPPKPEWDRQIVRVDENGVTLGWHMLRQATHYRVHYKDTDSKQDESTETKDTEITLMLSPGKYDFWIVAHCGSITSEKSQIKTLVIGKPVPVPTCVRASAAAEAIRVEWSPVENATGYRVVFLGSNTTKTVDVAEICLKASLLAGAYRIRVAACIGEMQSEWSEGIDVKTNRATPKTIAPASSPPVTQQSQHVTVGKPVTISWQRCPGSAQYELEWAHNEEFSDATSTLCDGTRAKFRFWKTGIVFVRVRTHRQSARGKWLETSKYVIHPDKPNALSVGISGLGGRVQWDAVASASSYRIEWSSEPSFAVHNHQLPETQNTFAVVPFPGLFARIKALTTDEGIESEWSDAVGLPPFENDCLGTTLKLEEYRCLPSDPMTIDWRFADDEIEVHDPQFELQIANTEDFENPVSHTVLGFSARICLQEIGTRFARVRFTRDTYKYAWSSVSRVQVEPVELQVTQNTVDGQPRPPKPRFSEFWKNLLNRPE